MGCSGLGLTRLGVKELRPIVATYTPPKYVQNMLLHTLRAQV